MTTEFLVFASPQGVAISLGLALRVRDEIAASTLRVALGSPHAGACCRPNTWRLVLLAMTTEFLGFASPQGVTISLGLALRVRDEIASSACVLLSRRRLRR